MIRFEIEHTTRYRYSRPVFLEPFTVRLRPRSDSTQSLLDFSLAINPSPGGSSDCVDLDGNDSTFLWFEGLHEELLIETRCRVETRRTNPFDFIVADKNFLKVPVEYSDRIAVSLAPYLERRDDTSEVADFAKEMAARCRHETLILLSRLSFHLGSEFEQEIRETGEPLPPNETLRKRKGSCRDLATLFMEACRSVGLAARFVSGYQEGVDTDAKRHMHAWAEVYIPGGGWRGYDPSNGTAVADQHVALAAAAEAELAAPTSGSFRGTDATSEMSAEISIRTEPVPPQA